MAFAGHIGIDINLNSSGDLIENLFNEELGAVIQIHRKNEKIIKKVFVESGLDQKMIHTIGTINKNYKFNIKFNKKDVFIAEMSDLHGKWSETSYQLQAL